MWRRSLVPFAAGRAAVLITYALPNQQHWAEGVAFCLGVDCVDQSSGWGDAGGEFDKSFNVVTR